MTPSQPDSSVFERYRIPLVTNRGFTPCVVIDTSLWFSKTVQNVLTIKENEDDTNNLSESKIFDYFNEKEKAVLLDTITWEFRTLLHKRFLAIYNVFWKYLENAERRIKSGEREIDVVRSLRRALTQENSHLSALYSYLEKRGLGFIRLLDINNRTKLIMLLLEEKSRITGLFRELTENVKIIQVKERLTCWATENKRFFNQFTKITPDLDKKDRYNILGCYFGSCERKDFSISFVTTDSNLLKLSDDLITYFLENRLELENQYRDIYLPSPA